MTDFDFNPRGDAFARLIGNATNLPAVQVGMSDGDSSMEVVLTSNRARHLGYLLLALSSEADAQAGYITTLRSHKLTEEEIVEVVNTASAFIVAGRMT